MTKGDSVMWYRKEDLENSVVVGVLVIGTLGILIGILLGLMI